MVIAWILLLSVLQAPDKQTIPGAVNVTRVDATLMCGGATTVEAFPEIKKLGFASVINLRRDGEPGTDVAAARSAAAASGLKYVHIPVDPASPSSESVDAFLTAVQNPGNQPMYIHCGSANRVAAVWMIKRVVVDKWDLARARDEAKAIGLTSPALEKFALDYLQTRNH
jgi:uncharacterized protein (TIGR01244 family)